MPQLNGRDHAIMLKQPPSQTMKLKMHRHLLTHYNLQDYFAPRAIIVLLDSGAIADNDCAVQRQYDV